MTARWFAAALAATVVGFAGGTLGALLVLDALVKRSVRL